MADLEPKAKRATVLKGLDGEPIEKHLTSAARLTRGLPDAAILTDLNFRPVYFNDAYYRMTGLKPREIRKRVKAEAAAFDLIRAPQGEDLDLAKRCLESRTQYRIDQIEVENTVGETYTTILCFFPMLDHNDELVGLIQCIRDIGAEGRMQVRYQELVKAERERAEELERQVAARTQELSDAMKELEERNDFIRQAFGRFVSDEVVSHLLESLDALELGGEDREVTIMMADLRGFSSTAELLTPEKVVGMLNNYLGTMADLIMSYKGTIDEFIGDAILAIFGAPVSYGNDAERAAACAIAMQQAMEEVNKANAEQGLPRIEMGIGLNTGVVVVGNIGSSQRMKYAVVGSHVNLTARIESYTVGGQILISDATRKQVGPTLETGAKLELMAKGFPDAIVMHDLRGIGGDHNLKLPESADIWIEIETPVHLHFWVMAEKVTEVTQFDADIVKLSRDGAILRVDRHLEPLTNLKVHMASRRSADSNSDEEEIPGTLYAKVVECDSADGHSLAKVRFTSIPPFVANYLKKLMANGQD